MTTDVNVMDASSSTKTIFSFIRISKTNNKQILTLEQNSLFKTHSSDGDSLTMSFFLFNFIEKKN